MNTIKGEQLLNQLNWRYATKQFDPTRKISSQDWATLEESLVLTPSSYGLQPWKFIVITDQATKENLVPVSWGQSQVADCSHHVVFAIEKDLTEQHIENYMQRIAEVRGAPIASLSTFRDMVLNGVIKGQDKEARRDWAARQVYIALGNFMTSAALLGVDTCPMEGIEPAKYNSILKLNEQSLSVVVACAAGYRASEDKYASLKKVRFPKENIFLRI